MTKTTVRTVNPNKSKKLNSTNIPQSRRQTRQYKQTRFQRGVREKLISASYSRVRIVIQVFKENFPWASLF